MDIVKEYTKRKEKYNIRQGEYNIIQDEISSLKNKVLKLESDKKNNLAMSAIIQQVADIARKDICDYIEEVCTSALCYVFDKKMYFKIEITEKAGRPNADFYIETIYNKEIVRVDPRNASGGGVIDVLSIALRFAFVQLFHNPTIRGPIILDEPAKMVSDIASNQVSKLFEQFKDTFDKQIIMCTHNDIYESIADSIYNIRLINNTSEVKKG